MAQHPWSDLVWWNSGERQVVEEKYDDDTRAGIVCNPAKKQLYAALSATRASDCRVAIIGQDPYPSHEMATGVAFSIPRDIPRDRFPPTLRILLDEYHSDLGYSVPDHGDLHGWTSQGVLLWNAIPSCQSGKPLSHDWDEWSYLTGEIVSKLSERGVVFAFLGGVAARYISRVDTSKNRIITTSHPSPRGNKFGRSPFTGSRIFSTINARLRELGKEPINWELKDVGSIGENNGTRPGLDRGNVLPNITGAKLGGLKRTATSPNIYTSLAF